MLVHDPHATAVPPMTRGAARHVTNPAACAAVAAAYHHPTAVTAIPHAPHLEQRCRNGCVLIVFRDTAVVATVLLTTPETTTPAPTHSTGPNTPPRPRRRGRRGGQGNRWPTTWDELRARLAQRGCAVERRRDRWRVTLPDGSHYFLPCRTSDWRALANAAATLRTRGVDVRADMGNTKKRGR